MTGQFRDYHHEQAGFSLPLHELWQVTEQVPDCALVAAEPDGDPQHFSATVVVTLEQLDSGESLQAWVARSRQALQGRELNRLRVLDSEQTEIDGRPAHRLLSHYLHPGYGGVVLEQWQLAHGQWGYVVSCSTGALDYDELADFMAYTAQGLRIEGVPQ